ncbi:hypothetical protein LMG31506_03116 [Cupriavidus yeoncheonensis]|uniref:Uncharacterized protein n=1 Tax=Cupriavidus yeoncheonensis TaxID=1462994 RepID=A0A916IVR6_9BURK|nr:hypothetical protein [Cupriavidus yeoncheonensis]CAG2145000.1 hypothetical protein LMG31506_03116 [Cupriavidus yeoncheonensis]
MHHRSPFQRLSLASLAAALALAGAMPARGADDNVLSTGPAASAGDLGLSEAIRAGEVRRGTAPSAGAAIAPLAPRPEYARLPVYVGKLGDKPVRLRIGPKPDERDSLRGEYTTNGVPGVRLLAGEWEDGSFLMEESDDGTRVSGNWEGTIDASGAVRGTWTDAFDQAVVLPFSIRPLGSVLVIPPFDMTPNSGVTYAPPPPASTIQTIQGR